MKIIYQLLDVLQIHNSGYTLAKVLACNEAFLIRHADRNRPHGTRCMSDYLSVLLEPHHKHAMDQQCLNE